MNLFEGLTDSQVRKLFILLGVHVYPYNQNEEVLPTIKSENIVGIVLSGFVQIQNIDYNGNEIIVENLTPENSLFGTNLSATNSEDFQLIAKEDSRVVVIDYDRIIDINNFKYSYFQIFFRNLFEIYNLKTREKNERIKVLEKKQIRDKLLEYFEIENKKSGTKYIHLPFPFKDLADYIGVNRASMFRELKHLKEDKLIEVKGRKITLLYK